MTMWKWMMIFTFALVACDRHDEPGQTVTTAADNAASATERTADRALDAGARELKREWNDLDVKVETGKHDAGISVKH
jgi:hypothetical protein